MMLDKPYDKELFDTFLKAFLPDYQKDERPVRTPDSSILTRVTQLGASREVGITVLEAECEETDSNKRIAITQAAFNALRDHSIRNAIIAFHDGNSQWRLSLLTSTLEIKDGKVIKKDSNPRRYSYVLGVGAKTVTPYKYLVEKGRVKDIKQLQERFSVEVVNKQFYASVADLFTKLVGGERGSTKHPGLLKINGAVSQNVEHQEFAVRLIGRIIFSWFLKEKKSVAGVPIVPSALLSLDAVASNTDYYHSILEPFFFELLNKRVERRHESLREVPFSTVPYLNGGLFSPQYSDFYNQNSFNGAGTPGLTHIPDSWFTELFTVLEQYNFTVDENTSYDVDLSIDPEMLGRIFENLLAEINPETGESARKSTGSFYTPREIVDYMVDSSLLEFLKSKTGVSEKKLKALISYGTADDEQYPLLDAEKEKVVSALASLTILDPACGSGAFPIGILQKVVYVLQRVDEKAELWLQNQLKTISSPELRRDIEEKYRNENYDYLRKLGVIRESIFGVDIQTIATEISKLRCFLTLVIEEDVDDNARNRGIRPLPNLDFKFVTANSLLGLPDSSKSSKLNLFEDTSHIDRLKDIRNRYFGADADERARLQVEFKDLQLTMFKSRLASMGATSDLYNILSDWNPFNHEKTEWFDSEWMFGVVDFDIVIANPPYVDSEHMVNEDVEYRTRVKEAYSTAQGNWDLFIPFIEKGIRETKELGVLTYIVPNKIIGAKYATELRSFLDKLDVLEIRDYSRINVFSEADVYPITICVRKSKKTESKADFVVMKDLTSVMRGVSILGSELGIDTYWDKYFLEPNAFKLIHKLSKLKKIKDSGLFIAGAATVGEAYKVKECVKDSNSISNSFKLVNTGTIDKYEALWGKQNTQYIKAAYKYPVVTYEDIKKINNTRFEQSKSPKLIIAGMSNEIEAFLDIEGEYLAGKSTTIVTGDPDKIAYYLAILNSKLVSYYVSNLYHSLKMAGGYLNISKNIIENIPLPLNDNVKIREKITSIAKQKHVTPKDIAKIDDLVYKLHDLTPDEIAIVENSSK